LQHRDELSKFIGDEISRTMVEQKGLERRYEELIEQRAVMKGMSDKNKYKEVQEEIQDVSRSIRESTNNLVRSLKENPNVSGKNDSISKCIENGDEHIYESLVNHRINFCQVI
jgi:IQ domain-containing protein G